ncbi:H-NS family nucleoid-associated regulatory protein [Paraburkholderia heleia]|uniref:H-NS family nucleoid-associated regulatory protein n=1 Tax=Paraburkholderia heleia TaxID=634127 RepID=UPI0031E0D387
MATLESIQAKIAKLQADAEAIAKKQSLTVVTKIRDLMEKHGLTLADLESHFSVVKRRGRVSKAVVAAKSASAPKYRDPKTGASWTGHGRAPAWIATVKDRSKFLVAGYVADASTKAQKGANRAGNYVRGPQAPKYRDPISGAVWSGRGRAPAWLAAAKDRTAFVIESEREVAPAGIAAKEVSAKKAAAKGAAAKKSVAGKQPR